MSMSQRKKRQNTAATKRKEVNRLADLTRAEAGVYHSREVDLSESEDTDGLHQSCL